MKFWAWLILVMGALWLLAGTQKVPIGQPQASSPQSRTDGKTQCERAAWKVSIDGGEK